MPGYQNIKLSFWSLSFCLFVTLIKCHHPGLEKHWLVGVRTSSAPFVLRGWYQRRGKRRAEGLFFIVCFPYIYRCRRLSCWPPMPMPWALSPPQPARSRVFTWTWTDRYCRHRGLWDWLVKQLDPTQVKVQNILRLEFHICNTYMQYICRNNCFSAFGSNTRALG